MSEPTNKNAPVDGRADWVEPEVRALSVVETTVSPHHGGDGETHWADCTLS